MAAASAALLYEGGREGIGLTVVGVTFGALFMVGTRAVLDHRKHLTFATLRGADAVKAAHLVGAMTVHSFTEGAGVGVSFGKGATLGVLIAIAIAMHNIPEGFAVCLVLIPRGTGVAPARLRGASSRAFRSPLSPCPHSCSSSNSARSFL